MEKTKSSLWFGFYGREFDGFDQAFFDDDDLPESGALKEYYPKVKGELLSIVNLKDDLMQPYFHEALQDPPKKWKTVGFYFWGKKNKKLLERFPTINQMIDRMPGCVSMWFSLLEAGSVIKPHYGETNATYRVHLAVVVPSGLPDCGFQVKEEARAWKEGELLIFSDANWHTAFNKTGTGRYVLVMDFIRPEYRRFTRYICVHSLSALSVFFVLSKMPSWLLKKLSEDVGSSSVPKFVYKLILLPFQGLWSVWWQLFRR